MIGRWIMLNIEKLNNEQGNNNVNKPIIPKEIPYSYPTGWICPKCGRVYGPFMNQCPFCNKMFEVTCIYY